MTSLAWQIARRCLAGTARYLPDWPDALAPEEIAALQYPSEGNDADKSKARKYRWALIEAIKLAIESGNLATTSRPVAVPIMESRIDYEEMRRRKLRHQERDDSRGWCDTSFPMREVKTGESIKDIQVVLCRDFSAWLAAQRKPPSEHIRAWFDAKGAGDTQQEEAPKIGAGKTAPIEKRTRAALIKDLQAEWPTIERDLQDASRNGLAAAAKLADARGWNKGRALDWAKEHGKLIEEKSASWFNPPAILPGKVKRGRR